MQPRSFIFLCTLWLARGAAFGQDAASSMQQADTAFHAGYAAAASGDLATARQQFQRVVLLAPQIEEGHSALGGVLYQLGDYPDAIKELENALAMKPGDRSAQENLALAYTQTGSYQKALPYFATLEGDPAQPTSSDVLAAHARALAATEQTPAAIQKMQEAVSASQQNAILLDELGSLYAQTQNWTQAQTAFEHALEINPSLASAHLHLGIVLARQLQTEPTLRELATAAQLAPQHATTQLEYGKALAAADRDTDAIPHFEKALALNPSLLEATEQLAMALQRNGKEQEAIPLFQKVVAGQPHNAQALTNLGLALVQVGKASDAIPLYWQALAVAPDNATAQQDLGVAYLQQSDLDDAIRQFRAGLALVPDSPQLHYNLGLAYKLKDDSPHAISELETAAKLDPAAPDPPYTLGILYMQMGRFDDAAAQLRTALNSRPDNGDGWAVLGSVYKQQAKYDDAAAALRKAIALLPNQPGPHITLAGVLQEQGKKEDAAAERKVAADLSRVAVNRQRATFSTNTGNVLLQKGDIADAIARYQDAINSDASYAEAHRQLAMAYGRQGRTADAASEQQKAAALAASH